MNNNNYVLGPEWFKKYQKSLVKFANTWVGRKILNISNKTSGIGKNKVNKIFPNCIEWIAKDGLNAAEFRTHAKYTKRLFHTFYPIWWLMHQWDTFIANPLFPKLNLGFDTLTVYSNDAYTITLDSAASTATNDTSVGSIAWSNVNDVLTSNDTRASFTASGTTASNYLKVTNWGFSLTGYVQGIMVEVEKRRTGGTIGQIRDNIVKLVKSDGTFSSDDKAKTADNWNTTDAYAIYGGTFDLWGESWTVSDINDTDFGVVISAKGSTGSTDRVGEIDHVRITVYTTTTVLSTGDGTISRAVASTGESLSTIRSGVGTSANNIFSEAPIVGLVVNNVSTLSPNFNELYRSYFSFDTSSIPIGSTLTSATLSIYFTLKTNSLGSLDACLVNYSGDYYNAPASDYSSFGSTEKERYTNSGVTTNAYNNLVIPNDMVVLEGNTPLGFRSNWDLENSFGGTWAASLSISSMTIRYSNYAGTGNDPKLVVIYTPSGTNVNDNRSIEIIGQQSTTSDRDTVTTGQQSTTSDRDTVTTGQQSTTSNRDTVTTGQQSTTSDSNIELLGGITLDDDTNVELFSVETLTSDRDVSTQGFSSDFNDMEAEVRGALFIDEEDEITVSEDMDIMVGVTQSFNDTVTVGDSITLEVVRGLGINDIPLPKPDDFFERPIEDGVIHELINGERKWDVSSIVKTFELSYTQRDITAPVWQQIYDIFEDHIVNGEDVFVYAIWDEVGFEGYCLIDFSPLKYIKGTGSLVSFRIVLTELL